MEQTIRLGLTDVFVLHSAVLVLIGADKIYSQYDGELKRSEGSKCEVLEHFILLATLSFVAISGS